MSKTGPPKKGRPGHPRQVGGQEQNKQFMFERRRVFLQVRGSHKRGPKAALTNIKGQYLAGISSISGTQILLDLDFPQQFSFFNGKSTCFPPHKHKSQPRNFYVLPWCLQLLCYASEMGRARQQQSCHSFPGAVLQVDIFRCPPQFLGHSPRWLHPHV